ncbi:MAG: hypothetical protein H3Z53_08550 [archaeon]|nr:hypothetical protein [archaeon]MCP8314401.1 hypothetical protein [archaeon]
MESSGKACWSYLKSNGFKFPVLGLVVKGPLETLPLEEALIRIDTGYDGFLLLNEEKYRSLGLHLSELPRRYWPEGETVTGEIFKLRRALTTIHILKLNIRLEGYADTFRGNAENLAGLKFIESLKLLLDGPAQLACISIKDSSTN